MNRFKVGDKVRTADGHGVVVGAEDPWMYEVRDASSRALKFWAEGELEFTDPAKRDGREREQEQSRDVTRVLAGERELERRRVEEEARKEKEEPAPPSDMTPAQARMAKARAAKAAKAKARKA